MKLFLLLLSIFGINTLTIAQQNWPILKSTSKVLSINDGGYLRTDYWNLEPEAELDVYVADKINESKTVTFHSDIDSISFEVEPQGRYNFIVLLNNTDSCFTQIRSGITYKKPAVADLSRDTIPFILTSSNNIAIQTILNKKDTLNLMFHTDASAVTLTEAATKKINGLDLDKSTDVMSWGGSSHARYSKNNILQIGKSSWGEVVIWEDKHSGPGTDGKFGPNLFKDKVLEINFDKNILIVHGSLPKMDSKFKKSNIKFRRNSMFIEGLCKIGTETYKNYFLIHTGYGGSILFDNKFAQDHNLSNKLIIIKESILKDSYGNVINTKKAILPTFNCAQENFSEIPVGFFEGSIGTQKLSVMGGDLLKRFNIIIDLQEANIYLKPNSLKSLPYSDV